jgi:acyl carrier protein phosphodiesterase
MRRRCERQSHTRHHHEVIKSMSRGDWLRGYASQCGIERALQGMAQRRPVAAEIGVRCAEFLAERDAG